MTSPSSIDDHVLGSTDEALDAGYDLAMLELDGVVYLGPEAVPGAAEALGSARAAGMRLAYITNNASRTPAQIAAHLRDLGMPDVAEQDVVTSAQAVAHLVADDLPAGSAVLVVGGEGLRVSLEERGLRCVGSLDDGPAAVVQGFHPDVGWAQLSEASFAIQSGLPWYASNTDLTVPTPRGIAPGNGSLVQAVANATGRTPVVAGKPEVALFHETSERVGGTHPLMVGDRLDTDIDGAIAAGLDSLVVLTGVSTLQDVAGADRGHRPTFVGRDLRSLGEPHLSVTVTDDTATCGSARAELRDGVVRLVAGDASTTSALRAAVALAWAHRDASGEMAALDGTLGA
jgi:glycerol 3-phosphatase-2